MNPFAWRGPEFLGFYAVLAALAVVWVLLERRRAATAPGGRSQIAARERLSDPYEIALLRAGPPEAVRVATLALVGRGLLADSGHKLTAVASPWAVDDPLERAIIVACERSRSAPTLIRDSAVVAMLAPRRRRLAEEGLGPDHAALSRLRGIAFIVSLALIAIAVIKVGVALHAGRHNVFFLVILAAIAVAVVRLAARPPIATRAGTGAIAELKALFGQLKPQPGREASEALFLTAVLGAVGAPADARSRYAQLFPKAARNGSSCGTSSSCGSTCSSSSSSSDGGSSCGSSGCGGGGCGGCGS